MRHKLAFSIGGAALAGVILCIVLLGVLHVHEVHRFQQSYNVHTYGNTNYSVQIIGTTVGKVETGSVLIVALRLQNPNDAKLTLQRDWFVLVDHEKNYYQPVTTGTQTPEITVPAHGTAEKEELSFVVPDEAFGGTIALEIGHQYFVMLKNEKPYRRLRQGQFEMFHQLDW